MPERTCKQFIFRSYNTSTFNAMRFDANPFSCQCEKEDKEAEGSQMWHLYWSFSSDVMAVKGLEPPQEQGAKSLPKSKELSASQRASS